MGLDFSKHKFVIGMLHLPPLPGSPLFDGKWDDCVAKVTADAKALTSGGVHALMMENFGDIPFSAARVSSDVVALMTAIAVEVKRVSPLPLGINVLRNDALSALSVAVASQASFIRVNVLSGSRVTDQGLIQGVAYELMRARRYLGASHIKVLADVDVKHSAPLAPRPIEDEVDDTVRRGLADGVIVSGAGTGRSVEIDKVAKVARVARGVPVVLGSGVCEFNIAELTKHASGFIVGTSLKFDGDVKNPVDVERVRRLMKLVQ
jgi:membrane complex biogenesis BtpA family protein